MAELPVFSEIDEPISGTLKNSVSTIVPAGANVDLNSPTVITSENLDDTDPVATYTLTAPETVDEGDTFDIELFTANLASGSIVNYEIQGVTLDDLVGESGLTGSLTVIAGNASKTLEIRNDRTTEGSETLRFLIPGNAVVETVINDTSRTPVYNLSVDTDISGGINEGETFTVTMTTLNVPAGETVSYSVSGVNSADLSGASLSGSFTTGQLSSVTYTLANDLSTEGTEQFTFTLSDGGTQLAQLTVPINDTSQTPPPSFTMSANRSSVNEGQSVTFTVGGDYINENGINTLYWTTSGDVTGSDFTDGQLQGTVSISNDSGSFTRTLRSDQTTEGTESFSMRLRRDGYSGTRVAGPISITVGDTSTTPPPTVDSVSWSPSTINLGQSTRLTWNTSGGESLTYTTPFGSGSGSVDGQSPSFTPSSEGSYTGSVTVTNITGSDSDSASLTVLALPAINSVTLSPSSVNEGGTVTVTVSTENISNGETISITRISGSASTSDITPSSLSLTVNNNSASGSFSIRNDLTTEGSETLQMRASYSGITRNSNTITINDTSQTPPPEVTSFSLSPSAVSEGGTATLSISTRNIANGDTVYVVIDGGSSANSSDVSPSSAFVTINNNSGSRSISIIADQNTEGTESFRYLAYKSPGNTYLGASNSIDIIDTSQDPQPSLDYVTAPSSVNEGSTARFTIGFSNLRPNTRLDYYIIGGGGGTTELADTSPNSIRTVTLSGSGTTQLSFSITADSNTEGSETFRIAVQNPAGGYTNSSFVVINDTSRCTNSRLTSDTNSFYYPNHYLITRGGTVYNVGEVLSGRNSPARTVIGWYSRYIGRNADQGGLNYWVGAIQATSEAAQEAAFQTAAAQEGRGAVWYTNCEYRYELSEGNL